MIEEKIENQPLGNEENKPKAEQSLIEIDGSVESVAAPIPAPTPQSAEEKQKPLSPQEKKNRLKEMKAKKEAEYKAKQKEEKQRLKELKKQEQLANGGSGAKVNMKLIIIVSVFVLLGGGFAFLYFVKPDVLKKLMPGKHKENVTLVNSDSTVAPENQTAQADTMTLAAEENKGEINETKTADVVAPESSPVPEPIAEIKEKPAPKVRHKSESSNNQPIAGVNKGITINGPCWIVSYSSIKDENIASKGVKKLLDKGFIGGYYWMPELDPNAKQLFKVYSGPYTSEAEARAKQREIVVFNQDAYVMKLSK